jgi:flagellar motor switch protein FliN/FliY
MADEPERTPASAVDKLLAEARQASGATTTAAAGQDSGTNVDRESIDSLLNQAQAALSALDESSAALPPGIKPFEFKNLAGTDSTNGAASLDLLHDVQLDLKIELGRTHMRLEDVLRLKQGAVVTLDKLAGDPVDVYANGRRIARGEVLVLNDNFCVRVTELISDEVAEA